ncbi:hypothetical protein J6590_030813, partial [Homalodisca vitripennis]
IADFFLVHRVLSLRELSLVRRLTGAVLGNTSTTASSGKKILLFWFKAVERI